MCFGDICICCVFCVICFSVDVGVVDVVLDFFLFVFLFCIFCCLECSWWCSFVRVGMLVWFCVLVLVIIEVFGVFIECDVFCWVIGIVFFIIGCVVIIGGVIGWGIVCEVDCDMFDWVMGCGCGVVVVIWEVGVVIVGVVIVVLGGIIIFVKEMWEGWNVIICSINILMLICVVGDSGKFCWFLSVIW